MFEETKSGIVILRIIEIMCSTRHEIEVVGLFELVGRFLGFFSFCMDGWVDYLISRLVGSPVGWSVDWLVD